ncbi:MAG: MBL fold metallo-hydrolase [Desulfobacteraceae bacterium]|nr:MBL fold metallo-hydrolase [Desulfobacteraceae bacterium]
MEITSEVFQVGGGGLTSPEDAAIYLIRFGDEAALVDSGCGNDTERLLANIRKTGTDPKTIRYLLITHCHYDHTGGASELKKRLGLKTVAHDLDAGYLEAGDNRVTAAGWYGAKLQPFTVDNRLKGSRAEILLGGRKIEALHTPGHSPGSVVYLTESDGKKVLFAQDVHGPLDQSLLSNRKDYLKSLRLLLDIEADILCEGHYGVYRGREEAEEFIRQFLGH